VSRIGAEIGKDCIVQLIEFRFGRMKLEVKSCANGLWDALRKKKGERKGENGKEEGVRYVGERASARCCPGAIHTERPASHPFISYSDFWLLILNDLFVPQATCSFHIHAHISFSAIRKIRIEWTTLNRQWATQHKLYIHTYFLRQVCWATLGKLQI